MSHVEISAGSNPYLQFARHGTRLSRHLLRRLDPLLREQLGISALELSALRCVEAGYANPMRVAERLVLPPSSASRLIDRLAELGHIERTEVPGDRRKARLTLTHSGSAAVESARDVIAGTVKEMFRGLPTTEFQTAAASLARLIEHLESGPADEAAADAAGGNTTDDAEVAVGPAVNVHA